MIIIIKCPDNYLILKYWKKKVILGHATDLNGFIVKSKSDFNCVKVPLISLHDTNSR